jgi:hypothetical protein
MTPPNPFENLLKRWTPRIPSAALRARVFAAAAAAAAPSAPALGWLAPAAALLAAFLVVLSPRGAGSPMAPGAAGPLMAMTVSNQSLAAYLPGSFRGERNRLAPERVTERFGWTKPVASHSSTPSWSQFRTNFLKR